MKLDILVPHYKEKADEITPLLDSIALQQAVDFSNVSVIIAHDGEDAEQLPEWTDYPFAVTHVNLAEHQGVSACRNAALDASKADYVAFCDADDMFHNACGLYIVKSEAERGFDMLVSEFIEETRIDGKPFFTAHQIDQTFVHGKFYKRRFLVDNDIRFCDKLTVHEDSYFVGLAQALASDAKYCPTAFYLWKWRDSSVCRHDPDYILKTYNNMLDSNDALVSEFAKRGREDLARQRVGVMVLDAYYTMNKPEWLDRTHADYRAAVEKRFAEYFAEHRARWDALSDAERMAVSNGVRTRSVMEGMQMETQTIGQWLEGVMANA